MMTATEHVVIPEVPPIISRVIAIVPPAARRFGLQTFLERVATATGIERDVDGVTSVTFRYIEGQHDYGVHRMLLDLANGFPIPVCLIVEYSKEYREYYRWPDHVPTFKVVVGKINGITRKTRFFAKETVCTTKVQGAEIDTRHPNYDKVVEMATAILRQREKTDQELEEYMKLVMGGVDSGNVF